MNIQSLTGTLFQIVAHATSTGVLFLFIGILEERMQTRNIDDLGGVAYQAPVFALFLWLPCWPPLGFPERADLLVNF